MPEPSDDDLVGAYVAGNSAAFEILYERYRVRLFGFIRSMGLTPAEAEDLFQETWLRAIRGMGRYRSRGRFRIWLFTIARNARIDRARKLGREAGTYDEEAPPVIADHASPSRPDEVLIRKERSSWMIQAVEALPPTEREVLELRAREEMSFREIAEVLDIPLGTALWRMHRAVKRLATACRDGEAGEPARRPAKEKHRGRMRKIPNRNP